MLVISAWCLKWAITDVSSAVLSKREAARKDTLTPNYTIIANFTADVKLFFQKQSAIGFHQSSAVSKRYNQRNRSYKKELTIGKPKLRKN